MKVLVLVPDVPQTLRSEVPWHFFQELAPLVERGIELCVASASRPEYHMPGIHFEQLSIRLLRHRPMLTARLLPFAWRHRNALGNAGGSARRAARLRCLQWNLRVLELARKFRPDVIHSHWAFPANSAGAIAAEQLKIPLVLTLRGIEHQVHPQFCYGNCLDPVHQAALVHALQVAARITVCCEDSVRRLSELGLSDPSKVRRIYHAVDERRLTNHQSNAAELWKSLALERKSAIVCVALMEDNGRKGHELLLDAFAAIRETDANLRLVLVGDGRGRRRLEERARELGIGPQTVFTGRVHPNLIGGLLSRSAVSVLPSHVESFANVVFESLLVGTPVISSAVGAPRDVLEPYGKLFAPGDIDGLKAAMQQVLSDPDQARERARAGGEMVRREMSLDRRADEFTSIYREIATSRQGCSMLSIAPAMQGASIA